MPDKALKHYQAAVNLTQEFTASESEQGMALRGLGFTLIELGQLDAAEDAFIRSLEVEPTNQLAKEELLYIAGIRSER
jgi:tetratricopeptide (TPR) repeat protein